MPFRGRAGPVGVQAADGAPGIGEYVTIDIDLRDDPPTGHTYWLIAEFSSDGNRVYAARRPVTGSLSDVRIRIESPPPSVRDFYVVQADAEATAALSENYQHDQDGSWDGNRTALPGGADRISNTCTVTRTR